MDTAWFTINSGQISGIIISTFALLFLLLVFLRINGLRSFSKMSPHDFAVTVAIGSILATCVMQKEPSLLQGGFAIGMLLVWQSGYSYIRSMISKNPLENEPVLLMKGSQILYENLKREKVTVEDLYAKLREANAYNKNKIHAVVLETTGDVSVLHGEQDMDSDILKGVRIESKNERRT